MTKTTAPRSLDVQNLQFRNDRSNNIFGVIGRRAFKSKNSAKIYAIMDHTVSKCQVGVIIEY
jgi:hypothetical protein